jgi:hypothetical protein
MDGGAYAPDRGRTEDGAIDPAKVQAEIEAKGRAWAEARATAKLLDLQIPIARAEKIQALLDQGRTASGRKITRRDAEDLVLLDADYQIAQELAIDAARTARVAEAEYRAVQARFDAMRTVEATRRAEIHSFQR